MSTSMNISRLTERQQQIGLCSLEGMSAKDIACQLKLSINTVREHQKLIKKKLSCQNAYQVGYQLGLFLNEEQNILKFSVKNITFEGDHPHFWL